MSSHKTDHSQATDLSEPTFEESLDHVMQARREKLERIKSLGVDPFPYDFDWTHTIAGVYDMWDSFKMPEVGVAQLEPQPRIAGRLVSMRLMGKAAFAHLQDQDARIQVYFKKDAIGEEQWELFKELDIGDIVGVQGYPFITRTGERSLHVESFTLLTKSLRPLPAVKEKGDQTWYRWDDKEERYRQRTIDLIMNKDSRRTLLARSQIVTELRTFFVEKGYVEVETPILQPLYGGASAKPFITHHNALDRDFYLRIADELYLKRLVAGGIPRVFEIAKDFRNEGIDRLHSPEFSMLEAYAAYENYAFCMNLFEELLPRLANKLYGKPVITWEGTEIELTPPFRRWQMPDAIREVTGIEVIGRRRDELAKEADQHGVVITHEMGVGKIIDELFSIAVQPLLIQPTFITDHPVELSPLAKRHRTDPNLVERFELFMGGMEVVNAFSELNDPIDQRKRFEEQARLRAAGDEEAAPIDEEFLAALEVGMPPTAGLGMGVDRLVMLLTDSHSIRDVILFPLLRPRQ